MRSLDVRTESLPVGIATTAAGGLAGRLLFPLAFALADSAALLVAATASHWLPGTPSESGWQGFLPGVRFMYPLAFWVASLSCLSVFGFYDRLRTAFRKHELVELYRVLAVSVIVAAAVTLVLNGEAAAPLAYVATWLIAPPALVAARGLVRWLRRQVAPASTQAVPVLVLGEDESVQRLATHLESLPELDLAPVDEAGDDLTGSFPATGDISRLAWESGVRHLVVVLADKNAGNMLRVAARAREVGLRVTCLQPATGPSLRASSPQVWEDAAVVELVGAGTRRDYERAKRALDLVATTALSIALLPVMVAVAIAIKLDSPGPALIRQTRVGRDGRPFPMYKFRSMRTVSEEIPKELRRRNEATGPLFKIRRDPRTTRVGRFLRRASLDELPQLLNVLRGEMSLVGPRPPLPREMPGYDEVQRRRLTVTPGITGMWQVSGRSNLTFEEMLSLDLEYIEKRSLALDFVILVKTLPCVLGGKGAC